MIEKLKNFIEFKNSELLNELEKNCLLMSFSEEKIILENGSEIPYIPLVLNGNIKVIQEDASGKEILLYYIKAGESCIMSILATKKGTKSLVRALVSENSELLLIPSNLINSFFSKFKDWNDFVFNLYQKRFDELINVVNELAFSKVDDRILELLQKKVSITGNREIIITHQQLADDLGTAREVVSRLLKRLENEGKVTLKRGKIEVLFLE